MRHRFSRQLLPAAALILACSPLSGPAPSDQPTHPMYAYSLTIPTNDVRAGDVVPLQWRATRNGESAQRPPKLQLCFALIGSYGGVQDLKSAPLPGPTCPIVANGAVYTSPVVEVDPWLNAPVAQDLVVPSNAPEGLYNVVQVSLAGGSAMSAAGIVKVVR